MHGCALSCNNSTASVEMQVVVVPILDFSTTVGQFNDDPVKIVDNRPVLVRLCLNIVGVQFFKCTVYFVICILLLGMSVSRNRIQMTKYTLHLKKKLIEKSLICLELTQFHLENGR